MRRAVSTLLLATVVLVPLAACGGSDGDDSSVSTLERVDGGAVTTKPTIAEFDPNAKDTRVPIEESSTTTSTIPDGGDPEEFCRQYGELEAEFADQPVYTQASVDAIESLKKTVPPSLQDDLQLVADTYETLIGVSLEEMQDPARQAEAFPRGVTDALGALEAWVQEVC